MTARTCRVFITTAAMLLAGAAVVAPSADAAKPKAPAAVSKPRVGAASSTAVVVSWTNSKSKNFMSTIVRVAAGTKAPKSASTGRAVATVGRSKHAVSVSRLAPGTVYTVALFASDGKKHNAKGVAVRIQTAPGAISALKASSTSSSISLTYRFSASRSATAVVVRYARGATAPAYPTSGTGVSAGRSGVTVPGLAAQTRYTFSVWARDAANRYSPVAHASAGTQAGPTANSGAISGTVFGGDPRTRLGDARVYVFGADSVGDDEGFSVATSTNGGYLLYDLPVGRYGLCFSYDDTTRSAPAGYTNGCLDEPVQVTRGRTTAGHDYTLEPAAGFTGTVTGLSNADLVQDVAVYGYDENDESAGEGFFGFDEDGNSTDAAGKYTVTGLPASVTTLCFDAAEAEGVSTTGYQGDCLDVSGKGRRGKITSVDLTLKAAAAISGSVRGRTAGEDPLAGVAVVAIDADSEFADEPDLSYSYTQKNGTYTVTGLTPGDHYYLCFDAIGVDAFDTAVRDGFVTACQTASGLAPWNGDVDNLPSGTSTIVAPASGVTTPQAGVTLELGGAVVGTVRDAKSQSVGAQVYVIDSAGDFVARDRVGSGDTTFRVGGLAAGDYRVCVYSEDERFASQCYDNRAWSPDDEEGDELVPNGLTVVPVQTGAPSTLDNDIVLTRR